MIITQPVHEVPPPPPEKPERKQQRRPDYEQATLAVGVASIWVAGVHRNARDFASRHGGSIALTIELEGGRRVQVRELRAGPGEGFVTLHLERGEPREFGVRLDRVTGVEFAPARDDESGFRVREGGVGFAL